MSELTQPVAKASDEPIRIISCLRNMGDEMMLFNTYPADGDVRFMARAQGLFEIEEIVKQHDANVVVLDNLVIPDSEAWSELQMLIHRLRHRPKGPVVTLGLCYSQEWHKAFESAGALGTMDGPLTKLNVERLSQLMATALNRAYAERARPDYIPRLSDEAMQQISGSGWKQHVITVWSTKGGVGKSFLALNIAVILGVIGDRRTLLIDADMNSGDVHTYLRLSPGKNIFALAHAYKANRRLTPAMVQQQLTPYDRNLVTLLGAHNMGMTGEETLRDEEFAKALFDVTANRMGFDFVVWDLGQNFFEPMHMVPLTNSSLNLVVATSEKAACVEMGQALDALRGQDHLDLNGARFRLVINKWDERMGLDAKEIVQRLRLPEFARVPYGRDLLVELSLNHSRPLVLDKPNDVSNGIAKAASAIYPPIQTIWQKRGGPGAPAKKRMKLFRTKSS